MSLFMQALLVALFVTIAFIDSHTTQTHIFRPIVVGPVVGLIMGDVQTGFAVGVTLWSRGCLERETILPWWVI